MLRDLPGVLPCCLYSWLSLDENVDERREEAVSQGKMLLDTML